MIGRKALHVTIIACESNTRSTRTEIPNFNAKVGCNVWPLPRGAEPFKSSS